MGFFSRNESASGSGRRTRSSVSSEAQADDLRGRARRRLVGALALVIAAIIIVPMLLDTSPKNESPTPVVVPAIVPPPSQPTPAANEPSGGDVQAGGPVSAGAPPAQSAGTTPPDTQPPVDDIAPPVNEPVQSEHTQATKPPPNKPAAETKSKPADKQADSKPASTPKADRSDDGSVAIALLEGRKPPKSTPAPAAAHGNFVLQVAAYTSDKDAQSRREKLISSGVTNAYIENATAGGKTTYRLRVGPFPTREAAQAAQTRLRALGYDNGFISTK